MDKRTVWPRMRAALGLLVVAGCGQILGIEQLVPVGACSSPADCDDGNSCTENRCGASGICEFPLAPDGAAAQQTPGDCLVTECSGGVAADLPDDLDVPDDGDPCTADSCDNGAPVFDPQAANGHGCDADGAQGMCVDGVCVPTPCTPENAPTLCEDDNECTLDGCDLDTGQCQHPPVPDGPTAEQIVGDCQLAMCAGGLVVTVIDDGDTPDDGVECTRNLCNEGTPSFPPEDLDFSCSENGGMVCDGEGACVACNQPSQCGYPSDNACRTATCSNHTCDPGYVLGGTFVTNEPAGDCHHLECDGAGAIVSVADDADMPNDGNDCTADVCTNGTPSNPALDINTPCGAGSMYCNGTGQCVGCTSYTQCGTYTYCQPWECNSGTCNPHNRANGTVLPTGQTPGDCQQLQCNGAGGVKSVDFPADIPVDGKVCTSDLCVGTSPAVPSNPPKIINTACSPPSGYWCDDNGDCVQCNSISQCADPLVSCHRPSCSAQTCGTEHVPLGPAPAWQQTANDCKMVHCDGNGTSSTINLDSDVPLDDGNPCTNEYCVAGNPVHPPKAAASPCAPPVSGVCNGVTPTPACVECVDNNQCKTPPYLTCNTTTWTCG